MIFTWHCHECGRSGTIHADIAEQARTSAEDVHAARGWCVFPPVVREVREKGAAK